MGPPEWVEPGLTDNPDMGVVHAHADWEGRGVFKTHRTDFEALLPHRKRSLTWPPYASLFAHVGV